MSLAEFYRTCKFAKGTPRDVEKIVKQRKAKTHETKVRKKVNAREVAKAGAVPVGGLLDPIECHQCHRTFKPRRKAQTRPPQRFCSRQCSMRATGRKSLKVRPPCPVCGGRVLSGCKRACSKRCMVALQRTIKPRKCVACSAEFTPRRSGTKHCSPRCLYLATRAPFIQVTCAHCARTFKRRAVNAKKSRRQFCNKVCQHAYFVSENHAMYRGGHDPNRGCKWLAQAAKIRERDGYVCRRCGKTQAENGRKLDVDHIRPWRSFANKRDANNPANLVSLCKRCHRVKTATAEAAWLKGDVLGMQAYERSIGATS